MRHLLLAVWILVSAGTASADWDEVMNALERATQGQRYDVGVDPSEPGWVSSHKARLESERALQPGDELGPVRERDPVVCRASGPRHERWHCD